MHVRAVGMQGAIDDDVLVHAADEQRVLITTDTDFGGFLALPGAAIPSVLLLRDVGDTVDERVDAITQALKVVEDDLASGAIRRHRERPRQATQTAHRRLGRAPGTSRRSAGLSYHSCQKRPPRDDSDAESRPQP